MDGFPEAIFPSFDCYSTSFTKPIQKEKRDMRVAISRRRRGI